MIKEYYIDTWKSIFKLDETLSRKKFWIFVLANFCLFCTVMTISTDNFQVDFFELIYYPFIFSTIFVGIRRMNDIRQPWYYLFVPLLNIYLFLQPRKTELNEQNDTNELNKNKENLSLKSFLKIVLVSILIGFLNFMLVFCLDPRDLNLSYVLLIGAASSIPMSLIIMLLFCVSSKTETTSEKIGIYGLITFVICVAALITILSID
jgi:uncharacterized membrane protein YhaH (DUF805 family)